VEKDKDKVVEIELEARDTKKLNSLAAGIANLNNIIVECERRKYMALQKITEIEMDINSVHKDMVGVYNLDTTKRRWVFSPDQKKVTGTLIKQ